MKHKLSDFPEFILDMPFLDTEIKISHELKHQVILAIDRGNQTMTQTDPTQLEFFPDSEDQHNFNILNRVRDMLKNQIEPRQFTSQQTNYEDLSDITVLKFEDLKIKISDQIELKISITTRQKRRA